MIKNETNSMAVNLVLLTIKYYQKKISMFEQAKEYLSDTGKKIVEQASNIYTYINPNKVKKTRELFFQYFEQEKFEIFFKICTKLSVYYNLESQREMINFTFPDTLKCFKIGTSAQNPLLLNGTGFYITYNLLQNKNMIKNFDSKLKVEWYIKNDHKKINSESDGEKKSMLNFLDMNPFNRIFFINIPGSHVIGAKVYLGKELIEDVHFIQYVINSKIEKDSILSIKSNEPCWWIDSIGKIESEYANWRQQDSKWRSEVFYENQDNLVTLEKKGCKVIAAAQLISSIIQKKIEPTQLIYDENTISGVQSKRFVDANGNLSKEDIQNTIGFFSNNTISVSVDYWETKLNKSVLEKLKYDTQNMNFILGRANVGGGLGQHWIPIQSFIYDELTEEIFYEINSTSINDDALAGRSKRVFSSNLIADTDRYAKVEHIQVFTIRKK